MDDRFLDDLVSLREQVAVSLDVAANGAREYYDSWRARKGGAISGGVAIPQATALEHLRRRETLYLGEAAALQWILCRLDQLVAELATQPADADHVLSEHSQSPEACRPSG